MKPNLLKPILVGALLVCAGITQAQANQAEDCLEQKDKACLEALYKDIMQNPSPEKSDAVYYMALIYLEEENYEKAKDQFGVAMMFGDRERSLEKLTELLKSGKVEVDAFDCLTIGTEECFLQVAENNPEKKDVAYYLLAGTLSESDPERAAEYAIKAAELGHGTAECLLAFGYAHESVTGASKMAGFVPQLPKDYGKARQWGEKCGIGPFAGFNEEHFKKYQSRKGHKAYAKFGSQYRNYAHGVATADMAASLAWAFCKSGSKDKQQGEDECLVVDVDGEWVDYFVAKPMPERLGGFDDLIYQTARDSFTNEYEKKSAPKVFAQGPLGNWSWKSRNPEVSLEEVTRLVLESCHENWRHKKHGSPCKVININGDWVD